jgi:hypothetical protein
MQSEHILIRPYIEQADKNELSVNASNDGHGVYYPTHVIVKENRIVGYLSLNAIPLVLSWQDSKLMGPLDSVQELGYIEGSLQNAPRICIPCDPDSPYMKFLPKMGYKAYTKPVILFVKEK